MTELAGLLLGVAGPVQQVLEILKDLKERRAAVRTHKALFESLYDRFTRLSDTLDGIEDPKIKDITDDVTHAQLHTMLGYVKDVVVGTVTKVEEVQRYAASRFHRFISAKKHAELIETVDRDAKNCDIYVSHILNLLAHADTQRAILEIHPGASGTFKASFAVSKNDRIVQHDFESRGPDGAFETMEGRLKELILSSTDDRAIGAVAVGTGGVGKTCALLEIAQRMDVRTRFPGGTYFYRLGKDARKQDVISMLADFVRSSNGRDFAAKMMAEGDLHAVITDACNWFNGQVCLFVVDDIWETAVMPRSIIQDLSRLGGSDFGGGAGSRIAYSTRQTEVSDAAGGSTVRFVPREPLGDSARAMLFTTAQLDYKHAHDARFKSFVDEILRFCAGLPFTLSLAGRLLCKIHRECGTEIRAETFKICVEKLSGIGILNVRGESYFKLLQISIDHLDSLQDDHSSYTDAVESFCVLRKQDWVPITVCRHMWRISSLDDAEEVTDTLYTLGIVETEYREIEERYIRGLRFHDHVHSYAVWLAERSPDKTRWFKHVLQSYRTCFGSLPDGVCWPAMLDEDGYVVQNICRIMLGAGVADEVASILCTGQWVTKMMHTGQILQYDKDARDWKEYTDGSGTTNNDDVRSALSSLANIIRMGHPDCVGHPHVAWFQLYARLKSVRAPKTWMTTIMREAERHAPPPFVQARSACLRFPSDSLLDIYRFNGYVRFTGWLCDGTLAICVVDDLGTKMTATLLKPEMPPIEKDLNTAGLLVRKSGITAICISPTGTMVCSGHEDGTIRAWDITTGNQIGSWHERHNGRISSICICSDGSRAASGSLDCTVRVWDVASGVPVCEAFTGHKEDVQSVSISDDGSRVASGSDDRTVRVWDVASRAPVCDALTGHDNPVLSVSISGDGLRVASESNDCTVRVWDIASGAPVCDALTGHYGMVQSVSMSSDGSRVASGSIDCTVHVWDVASGAPVCDVLTGHDGWVGCVSMSEDGSRVASVSDDHTVRVWDVESGGPVCDELTGHCDRLLSMSMSGDRSRVASGSVDSLVRVWDVASGAPVCDALAGHNGWVACVSMSEDGSRVASGSEDRTVVWDVESGAQICDELTGHCDRLRSMSMSGDVSHVASGSVDSMARVWDVASAAPVCGALTGYDGMVRSLSMSGDGSRVASGSIDCMVRVWDVASGAPVCNALAGHNEWVRSVSMSEDGSRVASGSGDRTVRVWDVASGALVCDALTGHDGKVTSVSMSGDGKRLVSVSDGDTLRLWSADCGKCETVMRYDDAESRAVAAAAAKNFLCGLTWPSVKIAEDGRFLVIAEGGALRVAAFDGHINATCVSDDGTHVVAGLDNGVVAFLHVQT